MAEQRRPAGLLAVEKEMARQHADALASFEGNSDVAQKVAASLGKTRRLLLLGMGGSHAVGRAVEPHYRSLGIDAIALPLSEQLTATLSLENATILVTSQSGESAEVLRWFRETGGTADTFGLTMEGGSSLAKSCPSLIGSGGTEHAFAATRSLTVTFALHLAILAALGQNPASALERLKNPEEPSIGAALNALSSAATVVTSGRRLQGVAEAIALGFTELSRLPCFSLEGGQLRHGPVEMLGPKVGLLMFRADDATAGLVGAMATTAIDAGSPVILFDCSGESAVPGAVTIRVAPASDLAAVFALLPVAQSLMVAFAETRAPNAGTPVRSTKITRVE
ncbi:glucosamine-fructose-6-phosphate aminotransferase [Hartmannibacter diazotrophicus]|uniref:Glutamine--fructose-6-phosphate aminotransferase [isomerizing] n=2 Tax=Hartmannibacter diazotrophicus TaxID=1482074 RepID=A0A2C9D8X3_9HYPH|nr:glucosamine-fructose-6-phosphate aminotransferase [Hartmannibacter diazotrophicus]